MTAAGALAAALPALVLLAFQTGAAWWTVHAQCDAAQQEECGLIALVSSALAVVGTLAAWNLGGIVYRAVESRTKVQPPAVVGVGA